MFIKGKNCLKFEDGINYLNHSSCSFDLNKRLKEILSPLVGSNESMEIEPIRENGTLEVSKIYNTFLDDSGTLQEYNQDSSEVSSKRSRLKPAKEVQSRVVKARINSFKEELLSFIENLNFQSIQELLEFYFMFHPREILDIVKKLIEVKKLKQEDLLNIIQLKQTNPNLMSILYMKDWYVIHI